MSRKSTIRRKPQLDLSTERLHQLQQRAQEGVSLAAERVGPAAQQAREIAAERIYHAREWSAPRLDQAARYVEGQLGPRVGSFLSDTARWVEPPKSAQKTRSKAALIGAAGAAGVGVAGALAMRRKNAQESGQSQAPAGPAATTGTGADSGPGAVSGPGAGTGEGTEPGPSDLP